MQGKDHWAQIQLLCSIPASAAALGRSWSLSEPQFLQLCSEGGDITSQDGYGIQTGCVWS